MDHPLAPVARWRTRALVAATIAALELVVLVAIAAVALGQSLLGGVEEATRERVLAPTKPKPAKSAPPILERSATSVVVLNGNGISGAAAATATKVRSLTYVVANVGNAPRSYGASVVMHRDSYNREAQRLAKDLGIKLVGPLDGLRERELMGAHVAVVLGR